MAIAFLQRQSFVHVSLIKMGQFPQGIKIERLSETLSLSLLRRKLIDELRNVINSG